MFDVTCLASKREEQHARFEREEDTRLRQMLDKLVRLREANLHEMAWMQEHDIQTTAVRMGHGTTGKTLMVTVQQNMAGKPYAIVGPRRGGD